MTVLTLALAAATLLAGDKPSTDAAVDRANMEIAADPVIKEATFMATSIPEQAQRIRTEPRDAQWADAAEGQLRARYQRLVRNGHLSIAYIRCATSVCEVRATILDKTEPQITNTMKDLQLPSYNTLGPHPLAELNAASFVWNKATVLYWKRATAAEQPKV